MSPSEFQHNTYRVIQHALLEYKCVGLCPQNVSIFSKLHIDFVSRYHKTMLWNVENIQIQTV